MTKDHVFWPLEKSYLYGYIFYPTSPQKIPMPFISVRSQLLEFSVSLILFCSVKPTYNYCKPCAILLRIDLFYWPRILLLEFKDTADDKNLHI